MTRAPSARTGTAAPPPNSPPACPGVPDGLQAGQRQEPSIQDVWPWLTHRCTAPLPTSRPSPRPAPPPAQDLPQGLQAGRRGPWRVSDHPSGQDRGLWRARQELLPAAHHLLQVHNRQVRCRAVQTLCAVQRRRIRQQGLLAGGWYMHVQAGMAVPAERYQFPVPLDGPPAPPCRPTPTPTPTLVPPKPHPLPRPLCRSSRATRRCLFWSRFFVQPNFPTPGATPARWHKPPPLHFTQAACRGFPVRAATSTAGTHPPTHPRSGGSKAPSPSSCCCGRAPRAPPPGSPAPPRHAQRRAATCCCTCCCEAITVASLPPPPPCTAATCSTCCGTSTG